MIELWLHFWEALVTHILQFCEHIFAFVLGQVQVPLNLVHLIVDVVIEFLIEFEFYLLLDILFEIRRRRVVPIRSSWHRMVLLNRILHEQVGRQPITALRLRHHVTSNIMPVLELEVLLSWQQALPNLPILRIAVEIDVVERLLNGWDLLERGMSWLLHLLHSSRLVIVGVCLCLHSLLIGELLSFVVESLWLSSHVLIQVRQLRPIFIGNRLGL